VTVTGLAVAFIVAVLVGVPFVPFVPLAVNAVSLDGVSNDDPVCNSENESDCICVGDYDCKYTTTSNDTANDGSAFEPPNVEWCRRRPTWRSSADDPETISSNKSSVPETCRNVLDYFVDPEHFTDDEIDPVLSSTFDGKNFELPTSDEWYDEDSYRSLPVLERPVFAKIGQCTEDVLSYGRHRARTTTATTGTLQQPFISRVVRRRTDGKAVMAVVENALSQEEADAVLALAHCIRSHNPRLFQHRAFEHTEEGGGNDTTFLAGFLQILAPGVAHRIQKTAQLVWSTVGWAEEDGDHVPVDAKFEEVTDDDDDDDDEEDDEEEDGLDQNRDTQTAENHESEWDEQQPSPDFIESSYSTRKWPDPLSECGIRTTEHLSYDKWGVLGYHEDGGSEYTVLAALSDPDDYEGGMFSICPLSRNDPDMWEELEGKFAGPNCLDKVSIKPKKNSAIVFLSKVNHGVEDILTPGRVTFANELWRYGHVPAMSLRPGALDHVLGIDDMDDDELYDDMYWDDEEPDDEFEHELDEEDSDGEEPDDEID